MEERIKLYLANTGKSGQIGGGWTFLSNLRKGLGDKVEFVNTVEDCNILFIFGVTAVSKDDVYKAKKLGKKICLRADNIPKKSRNKGMSPAERLAEFGKMADKVVYQSEWCKEYAGYFAGEGVIINNGVDTDIFNTEGRKSDGHTYLYINYNDNPNKRFDEALYWFDMAWRADHDNHLWIAGNAPKVYIENPDFNWDLPTPGKVEYLGVMNTPEEVAKLMKKSDFLLFPSFAEACPNTLLEAIACGVKPLCICEEGGAIEVVRQFIPKPINLALWNMRKNTDKRLDLIPGNVKTIQEMGQEYLKIFQDICQKEENLAVNKS